MLAGAALGVVVWRNVGQLSDVGDVKAALAEYPVVGRFSTLPDSVGVRKVFWTGALAHVRERPLFGTGVGSFQVRFPEKRPADFRKYGVSYNTWHAHSEPIQITMEMGILGLAAFAWLIFSFYRGALKSLGEGEDAPSGGILVGVVLGVTALFLHNLVDANLRWYTTPAFLWLFLGLSAAVAGMRKGGAAERASTTLRVPLGDGGRYVLACIAVLFLFVLAKDRVVAVFLSETYYKRAARMARVGLLAETGDECGRAVATDPSNLRARYRLAAAYSAQKKYGEAIEEYERLEKLAPNYVRLHYELGLLNAIEGRRDETRERFARARTMGLLPDGFSAEAFLSATPREGKRGASAAVGTDSGSPEEITRVGARHLERGRLDMAADCFRRALELNPSYAPALNNLAGVYYGKRDYARAIELCKRALALNPDAHNARVNLGRCYDRLGRKGDAVREWREVLRRKPDHKAALKALTDADKSSRTVGE